MTARKAAAPENPLVPHAALRSIYTSMAEARLLERHLQGRGSRPVLGSIRGEEACRASATSCLEPGDLVSDPSRSAASDFLLGASLDEVLRAHSERRPPPPTSFALGARRLPQEATSREQLQTAVGAAHALKLSAGARLVLTLTCPGTVQKTTWRWALSQAGARQLPILFVILPTRKTANSAPQAGLLSGQSQRRSVPGIPVDATDAVALYRVLQESTARARAGDGPTLIECLHWRPAGRSLQPTDPLISMSLAMVARGAGSPAWQRTVTERFQRKLQAYAG